MVFQKVLPMKIIIIIPAYNEEASIRKVIYECQSLKEVLVIDDGSTDLTDCYSLQEGAKVIYHPFNMGLGASTRTGLRRAYEMGADIAIKIDADGQHSGEDIERLIQPIIDDRADVVFGSRFLGGLKYKMPLYRSLGNRFFTWLVRIMTGLNITDGQTGLMAFHRRYLEVFNIISDYNETQQLIIDAHIKRMRVMEVPVVFNKRTTGKSFISFKYPLKVLPTLLRLLVLTSPLKIFIPLGIVFILMSHYSHGLFMLVAGVITDAIVKRK